MISHADDSITVACWPRWWRLVIIGVSTLVLCSCRSATNKHHYETPQGYSSTTRGDSLPASAWTGHADNSLPNQQWSPPGISRPWPRDEYLFDGGDEGLPVRVRNDWTIRGLGMEDTIAHFDTIDGDTMVEVSNRVKLYSPRFGAVRQVTVTGGYDIIEGLVQYDVPTKASVGEEVLSPNTTLQQVQSERQTATLRPRAQQRNDPSSLVGNAEFLLKTENRFKAHENFRILRDGEFEQSDEAMLAIHAQAALAWAHDKGVQIVLDDRKASVETGDARVQAVFSVDRKGTSKLRIVKVASTEIAHPGDEVEFTLRFDNIGTEALGNVTIVDNLTTRLEYIPDTQSCSLQANFVTEPNDGGSLVLRWEIIEPVLASEGGIIRFKCRVR